MKDEFEKIKERLEACISESYYRAVCGIHEAGIRNIAYNEALTIVSEVEAEYGNGWIPCSERLPEEPKENPFFEGKPLELYLVSMKHDKYPWRAFWNGKNFTDGWSIVQPEAWMPLPDVYKPEKGEQ